MPSARKPSGRQTPSVKERMEAVEEGLLPAVLIRGRRQRMMLQERMAHYRVPGVSVAVINDGRVEWAEGYGVLEAGGTRPVDSGTRFQAASISKPVAAMTALRLVERGLLELDENVNRRLVSWKLPENDLTEGHPVTLRWLLSHRAGLTVPGFSGYPVDSVLPTLPQILDGAGPANNDPVRVQRVPGTAFQYSGGGTVVAQQMMVDVTGRAFADFMRSTVFEPLGMIRSTFEQPLPGRMAHSAASGHRAGGDPVPGKWWVYPELAAAGLWTTPSDLARWAIEVQLAHAGRSDRVLNQDTVREMLSAQGDGPVGLGPFVQGSGPSLRFSHSGTNEGYQCELVAYAHGGQGAAVMTNSDNGRMLASEILGAIADVYGWPDYLAEKTVVAVAPALLERYVGEYDLGLLKVTVRRDEDRLFGHADGWGEHELHAESDHDFFLTDLPAEFTFVSGAASETPELVLRAYGVEMRGKGKSK